MRRWHQEVFVCLREQRVHDQCASSFRPHELGRFRKRHALDCGIPHCGVCHWDKIPKRELSEQEILSNLSFREQMRER